MTDEERAQRIRIKRLTVAEALRPSMPRVSDLMDDAAHMIARLIDEMDKICRTDR